MNIIYTSPNYTPQRVTGRYIQRMSERDGGGYKVMETATATSGRYAGRAGFGYTLREYQTDGAEIPQEVRDLASGWTTELWPL